MKKFLLEADLHRIAQWLRFLGQDALLLSGPIEKRKLLKYLDRVFITTSRRLEGHLKAWGVDYFLLPRENWKVQLCLLIRYFGIKPELRLDRCYYCNEKLMSVDREKVKDRLPPLVYIYGRDFTLCPSCGKVYWKGSHHERLKSQLEEILKLC